MTREEAIETLINSIPGRCGGQLKKAVEMAIEALKQQDKRCKICKYFHNINSRVFEYYCPNCGAKMEVLEQ